MGRVSVRGCELEIMPDDGYARRSAVSIEPGKFLVRTFRAYPNLARHCHFYFGSALNPPLIGTTTISTLILTPSPQLTILGQLYTVLERVDDARRIRKTG